MKKEKKIITDNKKTYMQRRELSFEGLISKLENGEDGIYNFMTGGDKNILFIPKLQITSEDLETVPGLKELQEEIAKVERRRQVASGKERSILVKQIKEMRQEQYILKYSFKPPVTATKLIKSLNQIDLTEKIKIDEKGEPISNGLISFFNNSHIYALLHNYSKLKEEAWGNFKSDLYYLMEDLDNLIERTLKDEYPIFYDILIYKIDGLQNKEIVEKIEQKYNIIYSNNYISSLWCKKIPKLLAERAKKDWILWHYSVEEKGTWKKCSKCKEIKLAHPYFYTKNNTAKDGWYSLCKDCRKENNKKLSKIKTRKL